MEPTIGSTVLYSVRAPISSPEEFGDGIYPAIVVNKSGKNKYRLCIITGNGFYFSDAKYSEKPAFRHWHYQQQ